MEFRWAFHFKFFLIQPIVFVELVSYSLPVKESDLGTVKWFYYQIIVKTISSVIDIFKEYRIGAYHKDQILWVVLWTAFYSFV